MGLSIRDIVPRKEISFSELKGKVICVDAFNTLYQFLTTIRQQDGTPLMDSKKRVTSHLSGILYRNVALLSEGIKLVYVFDGIPPDLKAKTHALRGAAKDLARERYNEAVKEEDIEGMRKYSSSMITLTGEMIEESKELLKAMGIAVIQAPGEGEAQAAHFTRRSSVYAVGSQDYDSLLFGAKNLIQNLTLSRKKKTFSGWSEITPELIELERVLNTLEINRDQLICLGILVGTDYNPKGVPGIGPKKALQLVKMYKQPVLIFKAVEEKLMSLSEEDQFDWQEIFSLFYKPEVNEDEFEFNGIEPKVIKKILVDKHEFSEERVEKQIEKLIELQEKKKQKNLERWF
ncbi:MAG: flap endonuclease-1 [Nanoarchaeota archaeon]|nr:flap endonuclease-1 [Nanoarchaeota archaeon]